MRRLPRAWRRPSPLRAPRPGTWNRADAAPERSGRCPPPWIYSARRSARSAASAVRASRLSAFVSRPRALPAARARHPGAAREPAVRAASGAAPRSPEPAAPPRPALALPPRALRAPSGAPPTSATAGAARRAPELPALSPLSARRIGAPARAQFLRRPESAELGAAWPWPRGGTPCGSTAGEF